MPDRLEGVAGFVKTFLVPGSFSFLFFGLTLGVLLAYGPRRWRRLALPALTLLAASYWLLSIPVVSDALATRFHARGSTPAAAADLAEARAIVVLGAGISGYVVNGRSTTIPDSQTIFNALEAARLFQLLASRPTVIASGGMTDPASQLEPETVAIRDLLLRAGVPADRILLESASRTTHEQALNVAPMLKAHHWERFALVTPPVQMPRALAAFAAQGVQPIPAAAPYRSTPPADSPPARWLPNGGALNVSARAAYDYLAWAYYWMRGWLST
jgi:uncharacterized SAM-binding protein YcdF (DUF218 family)